jgi:hypothetical protein
MKLDFAKDWGLYKSHPRLQKLHTPLKLLKRRDHEAMEKELMYSSDKLKNRIADLDDNVMFCMDAEAIKPAFLRKKVTQGRNSDSQK